MQVSSRYDELNILIIHLRKGGYMLNEQDTLKFNADIMLIASYLKEGNLDNLLNAYSILKKIKSEINFEELEDNEDIIRTKVVTGYTGSVLGGLYKLIGNQNDYKALIQGPKEDYMRAKEALISKIENHISAKAKPKL